jgi:dTDP-glucose pyrophosphorylase
LKNWTETLLKPEDTLEKSINVLHKAGMRIALIVSENNQLLGTLTDGDIRRGLLRHINMDIAVQEVMNKNPITASVSDPKESIMAMMKSRDILHVPILNNDRCLVGLETLLHLLDGVKHDNPVFLMAGGFGTRLHPLTKEKPKPLLTVGDKPILETILCQFIESGFHNFYISTHFKADMVREHFKDGSEWDVSIQYVHEDKPLGTAGSLGLLPKEASQLPLIMMNGDLLTKVNFEHLLAFHQEQNGLATMCVREYDFQVPYGVIGMENHIVKSIIEKPVHKFFVNAGIYVIEPELIKKVDGLNYLDMPNLLESQIKNNIQINSFPIHEYWLDIGQMDDYMQVRDVGLAS